MDSVLKKNFSYLFLLQNVNYLVPLLLIPYLTRTLGVENFGKIAFAQAFVTYFTLLTDYGFNFSSTQEVVKSHDNKVELSKIYWSTTVTKLILAFAGLIIFLLLILIVPKLQQLYPVLLIAFIAVFSTILFPIWLFQGLEKMSHITWFNVVPKIFVLGFTFLLVRQQSDYLLAIFLQSAAGFLSGIACTLLILHRKTVKFYLPSRSDIRVSLKEGWHFFVSGLATNFYTTTNTVVLGLLTSNATVGIFSASEKIIRAVINLFGTIHQVTFPRINKYYHESKEKALAFGSKVLQFMALGTLVTGILIFVFAPWIVKILFGLPQYAETIIILKISSILPLFALCNGVMAYLIMITFGLKRYLTRVVGLGGIFNLLVIVPAILLYQAEGVAVVAILSEVVITIYLLYIFRKHAIRLKWEWPVSKI